MLLRSPAGVVQELVEAGYAVTVLDVSPDVGVLGPYAPRVRFVQGDIRDPDVVRQLMHTVGGVVHLAAMSRVSWYPPPLLCPSTTPLVSSDL